MAKAHGKGGSVTFTGLTAGVSSWSLDLSADLAESTDFADGATAVGSSTGIKSRVVGLHDAQATVEMFWDSVNTAREGDSGSLVLTAASGKTYTFTAIVEKLSLKVAVDGINSGTYTFLANGACTIA